VNFRTLETLGKSSQQILSDIMGDNLELLTKYAKKINTELTVDRSFEYLLFKILGPSLIQGYQKIPLIKPLPNVIFEIVEKNELNAFAIKTDKTETYIIFVCKRLITDIDFFIEELINWEKNPEKDRHKSDKYWMRGLFHQLILEHELSHIFNGHLDYLSNDFNLKNIQESRNTEIPLSRLYGWLNNFSILKLPKEVEEHCTEESRKLITSYSDLIMCFYVLNKFYFNLNELNQEIGEKGRSTPRERVMASFGNLILYIKTFEVKVNLKSLMHEINRKLQMVEELFYDIYGTPTNNEMWTNDKYFNHTEVTKDILMNWENIQPELSKYNYIPIAEQKRNLIIGDWYKKQISTEDE